MNERSRRTVEKIILHANKSISYTKFQGDGIWWKDDMILEAIVFNLAQIGELVRFVDESVQIEFFTYKLVCYAWIKESDNS